MTTVLPEINFLTTDAELLITDIIKSYEDAEGRRLSQADPLRIIFLSLASVIVKQNIAINDAAKQNLLHYSRGKVLDHKGAEWDTPRLGSAAATTTLRLHLSEPLITSRIIEKNSLATSDEAAIFFSSEKDVVIQPGVDYVDVDLICTIPGPEGNGFAEGEINTLIKPLPYISKVENITPSDGGVESESDEPFKQRVHLARERLSNAGSTGAYEYFAKSASALITDVYVYAPEPGHVNISVLLQGGALPTVEIIDAVFEKCNSKKVRPLTDFVTVEAPEVVLYDLSLTYYIETNAVDKTLVHEAIQQAINGYIVWQSSKIGRDVNLSKLISDCVIAGAKRVEITSPNFVVLNPGQVAQLGNKTVTFGGVEDD